MLYLNLRQMNVLHYLCLNENVELEQLSQQLNASTRTLQSDINYINDELRSSGFLIAIKNRRSRGYDLDYTSNEEFRKVRRQCEEYLDSSIHLKYGEHPRVSFLIRHLVSSNQFTLSDDLVDSTHVSPSTLKMDLKEVRKALINYNLELISVPYYGMKIEGRAVDRINCLVDFCDIINIYEENPIFVEFCVDQYNIQRDKIPEIRNRLSSIIQKNQIHLNEHGFKRVFIYLLLLVGGYRSLSHDVRDDVLKDTYEYKVAKSILSMFDLLSINDELLLTLFLIGHLDSSSLFAPDSHSEFFQLSNQRVIHLNELLKEQIDLSFVGYPKIENVLRIFIYKYMFRLQQGFKEFEYSLEFDEIILLMPATKSLAIHILSILDHLFDLTHDDYLLRDLSMLLFSQIFLVRNQYNPVNILVVGQYGHLSAETILYRLDLSRFCPSFTCVLPYELANIDFRDYDCLFYTSMHHFKLEDVPILSFRLDFYDALKMQKKLWETILLKRRKKDYIFPLLKRSKQQIVVSKSHQLHEVYSILKENGLSTKPIEMLVRNSLKHSNRRVVSKTRVCCIFTKTPVKQPVIRFVFKHPLQNEAKNIEELVVICIHTDSDVLSVKQADSVSKRIMNREIIL